MYEFCVLVSVKPMHHVFDSDTTIVKNVFNMLITMLRIYC